MTDYREAFPNQTRALVCGSGATVVVEFLKKILDGHPLNAGFSDENAEGDFIIFNAEKAEPTQVYPTIVLVLNAEFNALSAVLSGITAGGIVIYPENDDSVLQAVENCENYFRKLSYHRIDLKHSGNGLSVFQDVPLETLKQHTIVDDLSGVALFCQQLGMGEDEFNDFLLN